MKFIKGPGIWENGEITKEYDLKQKINELLFKI